MNLIRTLVATAVTAASAALVVAGAPAQAREWHPIEGHGGLVLATCSDGSQILSGDHSDPRRNRYAADPVVDADGNTTGLVLMLKYAGSFTHSTTGRTLDGSGTDRIVFDFENGTDTHTGGRWTVTVAGAGWVVKEAGRITYSSADGAVIDYSGMNESDWGQLCAVFGAG